MSTTNPSDGWCPFATRYSTSKYWSGNQGFRAVCLHIAQGSYEAAVSWLSNDVSNPDSSAHFVIAKDGRIAQLVSIWNSAWANGLRWANGQWYTPGGSSPVNPTWVDIVPGVNPNLYTISIEHEGVYQDPWTPEMYAANNRLLKWLGDQLGQPGSPLVWVPHRNLIGHYEIDPVTRANCPGPNVNYQQIAADANVNTTDLFSRIVPTKLTVKIYGTTSLVTLPSYAIVKQLTDTSLDVAGYLDYQGTRWYISTYSYQNRISNFFDSAATTQSAQDLTPSLALNPGYRDAVTPSAQEITDLRPSWVRVLLNSQYQNSTTGQNTELDWLLARYQGLNVKVLALVNTETVGQLPPPHGSAWGDVTTGYIAKVAALAGNIAGYYKSRVGAIQVYNEPDVQGILPEDYGHLLLACYAKIKAKSALPVVSAGICCGENEDYLRKMVRVARGAYDYTGWHAFGERVDGWPSSSFGFGELRDSLASARAIGGKPVWLTELGARLDWSWTGSGMSSEDAVGAYLTRAYNLMRSLGRNTVGQAFWFTWRIAGETWGLEDDSGNRRAAWYAFQAAATNATPGRPAITNTYISPPTLQAGQLLNVRVTVTNNSDQPIPTQGPDPGFVYAEGETFQSRGYSEQAGSFRIGLDFDGRTGIDHPYRWGLGQPLAPGASVTITGGVRLNRPATKNYWVGLVKELDSWYQDRQGSRAINVTAATPPPAGQPIITSVGFTPTVLTSGNLLNVSITVRNDSQVTIQTQGPDPGFVYNENDSFTSLGYKEVTGCVRVGVDFDSRSGVDHPYRWGLGSPLAPGQSRVINGSIRLKTVDSKRYWAGIVREMITWVQDNQGMQLITVKAGLQSAALAGGPVISSVSFSPVTTDIGDVVQVYVTVRNDGNYTIRTQGPDPGYVYEEGDNYFARGFPPVSGAFRIAVDSETRAGVDHPYRWGLGKPLAPGQYVTVTGCIRVKRPQSAEFWAALIEEGTKLVQEGQGTTVLSVQPAQKQ